MASIVEVIRGDNYAEDFVDKTILPTDAGYADWVGTWAIIDKLESLTPAFAEGTLVKATDPNLRLKLRIMPSDTLPLVVGTKYKLIVQVSNITLGFNREVVQRDFKIMPSGL